MLFIPGVIFVASANTICSPAQKPDLNNDGLVNYKDLWIVGRSFNLTADDYRYIASADIDCDGQVNYTDWTYVWETKNKTYSIQPEVSGHLYEHGLPSQVYAGQQYDFKTKINLTSSNAPFTAKVSQSVLPGEGFGLLTPLLNKLYQGKKNRYYRNHMELELPTNFKPMKAGEYQFTTQVNIPESGKVLQETNTIAVLPAKNAQLDIDIYISQKEFQDTMQHEVMYGLYLKVQLSVKGSDVKDIDKMTIIDEPVDKIYIDGQNHKSYRVRDMEKPISVAVNSLFFANKQCKSFHAIIETPYDRVVSKTVKFCATPLKQKPAPKVRHLPRARHTRGIPGNLLKYVCDANLHIKIDVAAGTSSKYMHGLIEKASGKPVHHQHIPEAGIELYIVEPKNADSQKEWFGLIYIPNWMLMTKLKRLT